MVVFIGIEDCQKLQLFDSSFFTALSSCEVPTPTNGAARFKPHCFILGPGSGTRFLKMITPTVPDLFCWWQPIFTWKGEQFKAMFFFMIWRYCEKDIRPGWGSSKHVCSWLVSILAGTTSSSKITYLGWLAEQALDGERWMMVCVYIFIYFL